MDKNLERYLQSDQCPVRNVLDRFGDKWSMLVLMILEEGEVMRFKELNQAIDDISQKMLTVTLRTLEADGLISRKVYPQIPPKVEYQLTELGQSLLPFINNLSEWAITNMETIQKSRRHYLENSQR